MSGGGSGAESVLNAFAIPMSGGGLDELATAAMDALVVLIGEQSHGTQVKRESERVMRKSS